MHLTHFMGQIDRNYVEAELNQPVLPLLAPGNIVNKKTVPKRSCRHLSYIHIIRCLSGGALLSFSDH